MVQHDAASYFLARDPWQPGYLGLSESERVLWRGHLGVAELRLMGGEVLAPGWSLPPATEVTITDRRIAYAHAAPGPGAWPPYRPDDPAASDHRNTHVTEGELRWLWPQHLRVQPGPRGAGSAADVYLVCGSAGGGWPALRLSGGDLATVGDADRLANLLRRAVVQFRLDHARALELSTPQSRILSRLLITPEFDNYPGGPGQTVSLPGAVPIAEARPVTDAPAFTEEPAFAEEPAAGVPDVVTAEFVDTPRPVIGHVVAAHVSTAGFADADVLIADRDTLEVGPGAIVTVELRDRHQLVGQAVPPVESRNLASRASELAARVADLVNRTSGLAPAAETVTLPLHVPVVNSDGTVRLSPARFAGNAGRLIRPAPRPGTTFGTASVVHRGGHR